MEAFILPLLFLLPLILIFSRTRRQQREFQLVQQRLAAGQEVMTTAGLYATVVDVGPEAVLLESAPGVRQRWARAAVARIVTDPDPDADHDSDAAAVEDAGARAPAAEGLDTRAAAVGHADDTGTAGPPAGTPPDAGPAGRPGAAGPAGGSGAAGPAGGPAEGSRGVLHPQDERRRDDGSP